VCTGLTGAYLMVAMLSLNMVGVYDSLIFKTGVYDSFSLVLNNRNQTKTMVWLKPVTRPKRGVTKPKTMVKLN
jgi:hypothetical protein